MIYFITARDIGRVKIGYSAKPFSRFSKIQSDSPSRLKFERVCEGGEADEAALHERFSEHRLRGEWFSLAAEIEAHMATLDLPIRPAKVRKPRAPRPHETNGPLATAFIERMHGVAASQGIAPATLSARILGSGAILSGMEAGKTITLAKFEKAMQALDKLERGA